MSLPLKQSDPAYWMLERGEMEAEETEEYIWRSKPKVYSADCYICNDPEFSLMGLPLCNPCQLCGGHVPADDEDCDDCGVSARWLYERQTPGITPMPRKLWGINSVARPLFDSHTWRILERMQKEDEL